MQVHLAKGGAVRLGLPAIHAAIDKMRILPILADAKFSSINTQLPKVVRGFGIAQAVASVAKGATLPGVLDIKRQCEAVSEELEADTRRARDALRQADNHVLFLRELADFIEHGTPPNSPETDLRLYTAASTLRGAKLLGDPDGICAQTVAVLREQHKEQVVQLAKAKDLLRKRTSTLRLAILNNEAKVFATVAGNAMHKDCLAPDSDKRQAKALAAANDHAAKAYENAYRNTFFKNFRRLPHVAASRYGKLNRDQRGAITYTEGR